MSAPHINDSVAAFHFPSYRTIHLSGGAKVFLVHDQSQELLSLSVIAKSGSTQETIEGEAAMSAAMLSRGTRSRSATKFADDVDALGASIRSMGHRDTTGAAITGLSQHTDSLVALVAECINEPAFESEEFERLRFQTMSDHEYSLSDPQYLAHRAFAKTLFGNHPYSSSRNGTLQTLSQMQASQCAAFYEAQRAQSEWFIIVAGNFPDNSIESTLEKHFGSLPSTASQQTVIAPAPIESIRCGLAPYESARQVVLSVGQLCINRHSPDYPALQFVNTLFGGYFLSRLNSIIREEKGFSYGVHSSLDSMFHASRFAASCSVSPENLKETLEIMRNEWQRLASEKISEEELRQCKRFILGSFARSMETPQQVAHFLGTAEEAGLTPQYYEDFVQRISALDIDGIFEAQKRCIHPDKLAIAASGKADDVRPVLEQIATTTLIEVA